MLRRDRLPVPPQYILVPYHLGARSRGPGSGVKPMWRRRPQKGTTIHMSVPDSQVQNPGSNEIGRTFDVLRQVAASVRQTEEAGKLPVVLSGNCNALIGAVAGLSSNRLGVLYFDAHGDANTADSTRSGYFEGMPLAVLMGLAWQEMASTIKGFRPIPGRRVAHLGGRDFDPGEAERLRHAGATVVGPRDLAAKPPQRAFRRTLDQMQRECDAVYVHVDVDVLDRREGVVAHNSVGGGPSLAALSGGFALISELLPVRGIGFASYNPRYDRDGCGLQAITSLMAALIPRKR
jgi:arginase